MKSRFLAKKISGGNKNRNRYNINLPGRSTACVVRYLGVVEVMGSNPIVPTS